MFRVPFLFLRFSVASRALKSARGSPFISASRSANCACIAVRSMLSPTRAKRAARRPFQSTRVLKYIGSVSIRNTLSLIHSEMILSYAALVPTSTPLTANALSCPTNRRSDDPRGLLQISRYVRRSVCAEPSTSNATSTKCSARCIGSPVASIVLMSMSVLLCESLPNNTHVRASKMVVFPVPLSPMIVALRPSKSNDTSRSPLKLRRVIDLILMFIASCVL